MVEKFMIQGCGFDTTQIREQWLSNTKTSYVLADLSANNEFLWAKWYQESGGNIPVILKVGFYDSLQDIIERYMLSLGGKKPKLILFSSDTMEYKKDLVDEIEKEFDLIGIYGEDLEKAKSWLGSNIKYLCTQINPLYYNYELLEWAKIEGLQIICTNPLGDSLSKARNIQAFSLPYLLDFAGANSNLVMLEGKNPWDLETMQNYLEALQNLPIDHKLVLKKTIIKPVKGIKTVISTFATPSEDCKVCYTDPYLLLDRRDISTVLGKQDNQIPELEEDDSDLKDFVDLIFLPEGADPGTKATIVRQRVSEYLLVDHEGWKVKTNTFGNQMILFTLERPAGKAHFWSKYDPGEKKIYFIILGSDKINVFRG